MTGSIRSQSKKWTLGLVLLGVVVLLWVLSSFLINMIFEDNSYRKPFFITYLNTASFIFYLVPTFKNVWHKYKTTGKLNIHDELILEEEGQAIPSGTANNNTPVATDSDDDDTAATVVDEHSSLVSKDSSDPTIKLPLRSTIKLSAQFCILWFLANLVTNASLSYTSVASQTILSSTSSFFTLLVSALCHVESVNKIKVLGSIVSFIGIIMVTKSDYSYVTASKIHFAIPYKFHNGIDYDNTSPVTIIIGNILALAGALFYGVYSTLLKLKVQDESRINMKIFFGFVGLFTLVFLWPALILLHFTGKETFEWPSSPRVLSIILTNCLITFISDFCWAKAMLLTSPLIVTVGLSTTIPLAMVGDFVFKEKPMTALYLFGAVLICGSFFIVNRNAEEETINHVIDEMADNNQLRYSV
ncbi:Thi74 [Kluyveromyces lactis]|nr:Thi74 [Kluyveromyces lactis]